MSTTNPQPGDMIEIPRIGYKHWAVYIGDGFVVHLTVPDGSGQSGSSSSGGGGSRGLVKKEQLREVAPGNNWRVNRFWDHKWTPRDARVIVKEALKLVGDRPRYHLLQWNCEHFATGLRYGRSISRQVLGFIFGVAVVPLGPIAAALLSLSFAESSSKGFSSIRICDINTI